MRYLVYLLIIVNLGYFAWYQFQPKHKPAEKAPAPLPAEMDQLVLLSERAARSQQPPVAALSEGTAAEPVEQQPKAAATVPAAEQAAVVAEAVEKDQPAPGQAEPRRVQPQPVCWAIGPLRAKGDITSISELLMRADYDPVLRGDKISEPAGYWVYLPEMPARDARRIVADLEQRGMKDYYIGRKNHISLGIFSSRAKARVRQKKVQNMGYDAVLDQRYRNRAVFWLDVSERREQQLPDSPVWEQIRAQYASLQVQRVDCEQFARQ